MMLEDKLFDGETTRTPALKPWVVRRDSQFCSIRKNTCFNVLGYKPGVVTLANAAMAAAGWGVISYLAPVRCLR